MTTTAPDVPVTSSLAPPPVRPGKPPPSRELVFRLYWVLGAALLVPVWMGRHFPSEDGLAHLAWTEVYRALGTPGSPWAPFYERSVTWTTPNLAYLGLQYTLGPLVGAHVAQQLIVSALIVAWVAASYWLSVQVWGRLTIGAFASLVLIHSSWLYGGYLSFLLGVPTLVFALGIVAHVVRSGGDGARPWVLVLALLGVVTFYTHLFVCGAFLLLMAVAVLTLRARRPLARRLATATVPALVLTASYFAGSTLGGGGLRWEPASKTVARFVGLAFFRGFAAPTPDFWTALALFAITVGILGAAAVRGRWIFAPLPSGLLSRLTLILAVCLTVLYVVMPDGVGDAYNLKGRLQFMMWAWLLPTLPATKMRWARKAVIAGVSVVLLWQIVTFSVRAHRFNAAYDRVLAAASLPRGAIVDRALDYEHDGFDGSFIKVLAHAPEDVAYHCGCVLTDGYHPSTAFYWVRTRRAAGIRPAYHMQVRQEPGRPVSITVTEHTAGDAPVRPAALDSR